MNPNHPSGELEMRDARTAARSLGKEMPVLTARNESEIDTAFGTMVQQQAGALVVASDGFFYSQRGKLASLTTHHRIPAIYFLPGFVRAGGLMSYGNSLTDVYRQAGVYVGRILKGEKPADLPVVQATKFELVINLQTAKALGIEVPNSIQLLADELIE